MVEIVQPTPRVDPAQYRGEDVLQRVTRIAADTPARTLEQYKPTPAAASLAAALCEPAPGETFSALAARAGISRRALYDLLENRAAVAWIVAHSVGTKIAEVGLPAVHARLLNLALTDGRPAFIELYLKRFDPDFRGKDAAPVTINGGQFAFLGHMSNEELKAYLEQKRRQVLGDTHGK